MNSPGIDQLRSRHPYPKERPAVEPLDDGWLFPESAQRLQASLGPQTGVVVELGAWLGRSTRSIARCRPNATVIAIDHWRGSVEHQVPPYRDLLPTLYECFLVNCLAIRDRLIPVRLSTLEGLAEVHSLNITPDLIYVDASHDYDSVKADLHACLQLFPAARIVGDDWDWEEVRLRRHRCDERPPRPRPPASR